MVKIRETAWEKAEKKNGCFKNNILKSYLAEEIRDEPREWGHGPNAPDSPVRS